MNKTITLYDLLGLIKDGKAPKKIKLTWNNEIWYWNDYDSYVTKESLKTTPDAQIYLFNQYRLFFENSLNKIIEILYDEDEFVEIKQFSKLVNYCNEAILERINQLIHNQKILIDKMKEKK